MTTGASKVRVTREQPRVRAIPSAATSVAGAVGIAERGPIGKAVLVNSPDEYARTFGGFTANSDLALAQAGFFENGGRELWVVRTAHYDDVSDVTTLTALTATGGITADAGAQPAELVSGVVGPFDLSGGGQTLFVSLGGDPQFQLFFDGQPYEVFVDAASYALADGMTGLFTVDGGAPQTVVFDAADFQDITNATWSEIANVLSAQLQGVVVDDVGSGFFIRTISEGSQSDIQLAPGPLASSLGLQITNQGGGTVPNTRAVTSQQVVDMINLGYGSIATADVRPDGRIRVRTVQQGAGAFMQVDPSTSSVFGFPTGPQVGRDAGPALVLALAGKTPGGFANRVQVETRLSPQGDAGEFDLLVLEDGVFKEVFPRLSLDPAAPRFADLVVNDPAAGSNLVSATAGQAIPGVPVPAQVVSLAGGTDGLVDLDDADFVGSAATETGLRALDTVQDLAVLLVPGQATPAVHNAIIQYCDVVREGQVFAVLDPPEGLSATGIVDYVDNVAALGGSTESAAIYWPRVEVLNPTRAVFGPADRVTVAPSGIIAGVYARVDGARPGGVYDPPAGIEEGRMFGVLGFETDEVLDERKRDVVFPRRINPLTTGPGQPRYIDGARTLKGDGDFPSVSASRGVMFISKSLKRGLDFVRHKNHTEKLRAQVKRTIDAFLLIQMKNDAFASQDPTKAFFADVSEQLNTPSVVAQQRLLARVGLAMTDPAEFVDILLSKDTRALEAELSSVA